MITETSMLYLYVETPLHAGVGSGLSSIDLPIQRERTTQYPMIQGSGIKGKLRAAAYAAWAEKGVETIFGPERRALSMPAPSSQVMPVFSSFPCVHSMVVCLYHFTRCTEPFLA